MPILLVLAGLAAYLLLFYASKLPSLANWGNGPISRGELLLVLLFKIDVVVANWLGEPGDASLLDRVPVLAVAGVIVFCAAAAGWLVMRLFRADRGLTRLETFVFSTAVGLSVVSTYALLVGLLGLLRHVVVFAVPAALTLAATAWIWGKRVVTARRGSPDPSRAACRSPDAAQSDDWLRPHWLWLAAPFAAVILLGGMLPPIEFDVREYHLQVPKEFYQQGFVGFLPHNVYGNMPMGAEMLSLVAMAATGNWWLGALAGKTVIAAFAPLTALGLFAAGRRFFTTSAGVVAAVVYLSIPWIAQVSSLGLVDGVVACYLLLAIYAVLLWRQEPSRKTWLLLAGYLAGGAAACKYPALLFVVAPLALWILLIGGKAGGRRRLLADAQEGGTGSSPARARAALADKPPVAPTNKPPAACTLGKARLSPIGSLGVFLLAAALGCGLWFAKNWALTGNPTYPLLYGVFGDTTHTWTPEKNDQWNRVHRPHDFSAQAAAKDAARVVLASEWLSPLVMPLAALALLVPTRRRLSLVLLAYFGYVVLTWWLFTHRIDRFWIPALPVAAFLAGVGACWSRELAWRRVLVGILVLGAVANFLMVTSVAGGDPRYFVSLDRLRDDAMRREPWHQYFNTHARDGRVLVIGDAQVFDFEVPIVYSTCFDDTMFERWVKGRTADEVRATLAREGITHVYVDWGEIARYRKPGNYGFTDFVQPAVFDWLVEQGVLDQLPAIDGRSGRAYRVVSK